MIGADETVKHSPYYLLIASSNFNTYVCAKGQIALSVVCYAAL